MMRFLAPAVPALLVLMGSSPAAAQTASVGRPAISIPRVDSPPTLDDYATTERRPGVHVEEFVQRDPGDLVPATERTHAYLSYDDQHLYVAFVCEARDPSRIRARIARREQVFGDDFVALFLDTFQDHQRAYMFYANPLGIQADGFTTDAQGDDLSFDMLWNARGRLTGSGYIVLMSVPFKSLRFSAGTTPHAWGIALSRRIPDQNEDDFWPGMTRRVSGFVSRFAEARGLEGVSPGRNVQFIPYGTFTGARFLDRDAAAFDTDAEGRAGLDAKFVVRDAATVDLTANPDFSQVESDEPQVTVNQRFEVFFPEKRPFFLENANYFQTPITLFFSRRLRDPQLGARMTGRVGAWAVGAMMMDDRAPGRALAATDANRGDRSANALARAQRTFGESSIGALVTSRDFGSSFNRVASVDTRLRLNDRWFFTGQAALSDSRTRNGALQDDKAFSASLDKGGRRVTYSLSYQDIGAGFRPELGFVPRTDIRQAVSFAAVRWRPKNSPIVAIGPNSFVQYTWDHQGELQDWLIRFPLQIDLKRQSGAFFRRAESMERFAGFEFRQHENYANFHSSYISWLDVSLTFANGTRPNFFPAEGLAPFLAEFRDGSLSLTFRPTSRLLVDETYIYTHLGARSGTPHTGTVFDNHIARSRVNYQFSRELSLRAIVDYNAVLSNPALVGLDRSKHLTADVLLTYLLNPGTALYVGVTDGFDNVALDPVLGIRPSRSPTTSTGRQFFVKTSYLLRF